MRPLLALLSAFLLVCSTTRGETIPLTFAVDTSQSYLTLSFLLGGTIPVAEQLPGSLTAKVEGYVQADVEQTGAGFTSIALVAAPSVAAIAKPGPFLPQNGPADFAGIFDLGQFFPGVVGTSSLLDTTIELSGTRPIDAAGNFDMAGLFFQGNALMVWDVPGVTTDSYYGYENDFTTAPSTGTLTRAGDLLTLTMPYTITILENPPQLGGISITWTFTGLTVATALVPEPSAWITIAIGAIALGLFQCRRAAVRE